MTPSLATWVPLPKRWFAGRPQVVKFRCNVCGAPNKRPMAELTREGASCGTCGSTVRTRAVVHHVSQALFGKSTRCRCQSWRGSLKRHGRRMGL